MADKQSPANLKQLAVNKVVDSLNETVKEMDRAIIASNTHKEDNGTPEEEQSAAQAAFKIMDVRKYVHSAVAGPLKPVVLQHVIARAIAERNIPLIRLAIPSDVDVLDFRALDYWITQKTVPNRPIEPSESSEYMVPIETDTRRRSKQLQQFRPPNEFDWFSWDKMGKIITMPEACELFSIMSMSQCTHSLKELMLNSRRQTYWSCPMEQMPIITEALVQMKCLTKLIIRGMADNYMLKLIGQNIPGLKHLDVSFSQYVTDEGILKLFFDEVKEKSAFYLIPSWMQKNLDRMWPLVNTLEYFDFSWTAVTSQSRKMVNLIPGSYMFKRLLAVSENEGFAQHIFVRRTPNMCSNIRTHDTEDKFEADLQLYAGKKGCSSFMKFINGHPWRNCSVSVYKDPDETKPGSAKTEDKDPALVTAVITPSKEEKRIQGLVTFESGHLTELYSIFPININQAGVSCQHIKILRGVVTDAWKQDTSLLPSLTQLDVFAEPDCFLSMLKFCPHLKRIRLRIIRKILTDQPILSTVANSMCRGTLEELWIAPGSYKRIIGVGTPPKSLASVHAGHNTSSASVHPVPVSVSTSKSQNIHPSQEDITTPLNTGTKHFHADTEEGTSGKDVRIEDLVQLSISCARSLMEHCPKLRRIGNLSWWWVTEAQLEALCADLVSANSEVNLLWDNMVMPGGCRFRDGRIYPV